MDKDFEKKDLTPIRHKECNEFIKGKGLPDEITIN